MRLPAERPRGRRVERQGLEIRFSLLKVSLAGGTLVLIGRHEWADGELGERNRGDGRLGREGRGVAELAEHDHDGCVQHPS